MSEPEYIELIYFIVNIVVLLLYFTVLEEPFNKGQTIGKRLTSIKVINKSGNEKITYAQSFIQTL